LIRREEEEEKGQCQFRASSFNYEAN